MNSEGGVGCGGNRWDVPLMMTCVTVAMSGSGSSGNVWKENVKLFCQHTDNFANAHVDMCGFWK